MTSDGTEPPDAADGAGAPSPIFACVPGMAQS
jgi:hypothetical protein